MGVNAGPKIKSDGVILRYDFTPGSESFPGAPTTNLFLDGIAEASDMQFNVGGYHGVTPITVGYKDQKGRGSTYYSQWEGDDGPSGSSGSGDHYYGWSGSRISNTTTEDGDVYFLTYDYKFVGSQPTAGSVNWQTPIWYGEGWKVGVNGTATLISDTELSDGWNRKIVKYDTYSSTGGTAQTPVIRFSSGYKAAGNGTFRIYLDRLQLEKNNYYSPFTTGTRSTTNALKDLSNSNNHADLNNVSFNQDGTIYFNGIDNDITFNEQPFGPNFESLPEFTIEMWVSWNSNTWVLGRGSTFRIRKSGDDIGFWTRAKDYGSSTEHFTTGVGLVTGQTYHVVCVYDGTSKRVYVDGVKELDVAYDVEMWTGNTDFTIGQQYPGSGNYFDGELKALTLYDKALSDTDVNRNYIRLRNKYQ